MKEKEHSDSGKHFLPYKCFIKSEFSEFFNRNIQMLYTHDGTPIPRIIETKVVDNVSEEPYAIVKLYVDLK